MKFRLLGCALFWGMLLCSGPLLAAQTPGFVVADIRIEGLQRIPVDRVYGYLPINVGDRLHPGDVQLALRELFRTGDFQDIEFGREGDVLVVRVKERPAISDIAIEGNKSIDEDQLLNALKDAGLAKGEVFRRSTLEGIRGELQRQYVAQGRYSAKVETIVTPEPRNRVSLKIKITEGKVAKIRQVNIIGNHVFDDETLLEQFELKPKGFWDFFKNSDKYSRERLSSDLETLRSWYMDRGYIRFAVDSTQVSITPDKKSVYITINVTEGEQYRIRDVKLAGDMVVEERFLRPLIVVQPGQIFSQQLVTFTNDVLTKRLGNEGYTFAEVNGIPQINEEDKTVTLTFFVEPGNRIYVRRVEFYGNIKTHDEVLRREMRQFEGAPASTALMELSKSRLERLGFFATVDYDTPRVPGINDQIDVVYTVEEQPSGSIGANLGYSESSGLSFGASVSQSNFFGSGNRVSFSINNSEVRDSYSFSFLDPYYTDDGVSRGFNLFYQETDYDETTISSFSTDRRGGGVTYGYPINETQRLTFGFSYDNTQIEIGDSIAIAIKDFVDREGFEFDTYAATVSWRQSTLNRGLLADRGFAQGVSLEAALPGSGVTYYKLSYNGERYFPMPWPKKWTLRTRADVAFGGGYGDSPELPFYKNFYAGGISSVRGYETSSLGPRSPAALYVYANEYDPDPDPIGGNLLVEGSLELIFPVPFAPDARSVRTLLFVDTGNVFQTDDVREYGYRDSNGIYHPYSTVSDFDTGELRYSFGLSLAWYTAIGPLSFTFAQPFRDQLGDDTETFQFSLGQVF